MVGNTIYMSLPGELKEKALFAVKNGSNVSEVARSLGVSRKAVYAWLKRKDTNTHYIKGKKHPNAKYPKAFSYINRWVVAHPGWSARHIAQKLEAKDIKLSHVQVNYLLKRIGAEDYDRRINYARNFAGPGRLLSDIRREIVDKAGKGTSVSALADEYKVARKTIYKWVKKYSAEGHLNDKYVKGELHPRAIYPALTPKVLEEVDKSPELSVHSLAKVFGISSWTIWDILAKHDLNTKAARVLYAESQKAQAMAKNASQVEDRTRSVFESFTPNTAPAPPPSFFSLQDSSGRFSWKLFIKYFLASTGSSFAVTLLAIYWYRMLFINSTGPVQALGLIFSTISLFMGAIFFLYSLKYYITLAFVLSYSQEPHNEENKDNVKLPQKGINLLSKILGLAPDSNIQSKRPATGLESDLSYVKLINRPFVSVHIPFYNEKNVVERAIRASTNFKYGGDYEVILCDDSTDETTSIIRKYQEDCLFKGEKLREVKGDGFTLTSVEIKPGVTLKHLHRTTRDGYKGKALDLALKLADIRTEFVAIFDADFVPYPDSLELFLKYFKANNGMSEDYSTSKTAAVQGYQWHVLNKSENWITRGVRSEYAGSYVIERSGSEIYGGLKQISGSVYMIRADILRQIGWGSSITEDFELTLKLYDRGYKVLYTPYIQAPAECVSTIKRLVRQRMRWAEGHSFNVKRMIKQMILNPAISFTEKLELVYLAPYYLQAFFFLIGTLSWLIAETVFRTRLPFWTELWGWSLVLTNMVTLPLVNSVGLFVEESERKDYTGIASFVALSYLLVPFQAYAAVKGLIENEEGPWFRTPKTGRITDLFSRGTFYRFIEGFLPGKLSEKIASSQSPYLALASANNTFDKFDIRKSKNRIWVGKAALATLLLISNVLMMLAPSVPYFIKPTDAHAQNFGTIADNNPQTADNSINVQNNYPNGVMVVNTDKSFYFPGETAKLQIGVIDSKGDTTCDADLILNIYGPDGSIKKLTTKDGTIRRSSTCSTDNNVTDNPDYYAYFKAGKEGIYNFDLINGVTKYQYSNYFEVKNSAPARVERTSATRINPFKSDYKMTVKVTAYDTFLGDLKDTLGGGFSVTSGSSELKNIVLNKGETKIFEYIYSAPKHSPDLYNIGPLVISNSAKTVSLENKAWNIASDANCISTATGNWSTITWTNCASGPQSADTVTITQGQTVTVDVTQIVSGITIGSGGTSSTALTFSTIGSLTVNGTITLNQPTRNSNSTALNVNGGTLTVSGAITLNNSSTT